MSVKVSLKGELVKVKEFPKLMIDEDSMIVLFNMSEEGFVVCVKSGYHLCYYSSSWAMEFFKDYEGEITLKNE